MGAHVAIIGGDVGRMESATAEIFAPGARCHLRPLSHSVSNTEAPRKED